MKKFRFVMIAAIIAIGMSAFGTNSAKVTSYLYQDDLGAWQTVPSTINVPSLCPASNVKQCKLTIDGTQRDIFNSNQTPYMRN